MSDSKLGSAANYNDPLSSYQSLLFRKQNKLTSPQCGDKGDGIASIHNEKRKTNFPFIKK